MAAPAVADKADNAFMMICTALVLFMTIPGIALFYGGLIRGKNVLSMLTQVAVTFALVCVLWVVYGYSLAFGEGNAFFGNVNWAMLKNIELTAVMGSFYQYIHVAFQGSFACITVGLIVGALAERIRFSAVLIFVVVWLTLSHIPIAHMVWGGGLLASHGALDFAGGTVVHINAAVAGGRRLPDWQARGLREGSIQAAQSADGLYRHRHPLLWLVRLQRRFSQRR